ncbi:MAG: hypothetical protein FWE98_02920 [Oscillospiraceae bacterium]|nr:hypothetical protein [Oscillospiraceae bacterium]
MGSKKNLKRLLAIFLTCVLFADSGMVFAADPPEMPPGSSDAAAFNTMHGLKPISVRAGEFFGGGNGDADSWEPDEFASGRIIVRVSGGTAQPFSSASFSGVEPDAFFGVEIDGLDDLMILQPQQAAGILSASTPDTLKVLTLKDKSSEAVTSAIEKLN